MPGKCCFTKLYLQLSGVAQAGLNLSESSSLILIGTVIIVRVRHGWLMAFLIRPCVHVMATLSAYLKLSDLPSLQTPPYYMK